MDAPVDHLRLYDVCESVVNPPTGLQLNSRRDCDTDSQFRGTGGANVSLTVHRDRSLGSDLYSEPLHKLIRLKTSTPFHLQNGAPCQWYMYVCTCNVLLSVSVGPQPPMWSPLSVKSSNQMINPWQARLNTPATLNVRSCDLIRGFSGLEDNCVAAAARSNVISSNGVLHSSERSTRLLVRRVYGDHL